ncbi:MAG: NFACT family protein [Abitibacteriaceae bacterium]|nr:NFACT family protein [Abditibacteriaceae bacterium]
MSRRINFDSLTLASTVDSLQVLLNGSIQRISQPSEYDLVLTVYAARYGEARWLINCSTQWARTHLVTQRLPNPPQPPAFCMTLRKYIEGGTILSIAQRRFDRILDVTIRGHEGQVYLLTAELMGRHSNIILVSPDGFILQAAKLISSKVNRVREVLPGRDYLPPPDQGQPDPRGITADHFQTWLASAAPDDFPGWLRDSFEGISGILAGEIDSRSTQAQHSNIIAARWAAFESVFRAGREHTWRPVQVRDTAGTIIGAYPLPLQGVPATQQTLAPDIHTALEHYYSVAVPQAIFEQQQRSLLGALQKALSTQRHALRQVQQGVQERGRADQYRRWGELILTNLHQIQKGQDKAELLDYYADPPATITVALEPTQTPQQNAERLYQRARHVENNANRLKALQQQLGEQAEAITTLIAQVEQSADTAQLESLRTQATRQGWLHGTGATAEAGKSTAKSQAQQKPAFEGKRIRALTSPEGWQVLLGENAEANDYLVQRVSRPNDWWLHVRAGTGSHVVIPTQNNPQRVPTTTLMFAAQLAAANSRARHSSLVAVDYTLRKYVRRPRGGAPGFVTTPMRRL